jgi:isocitrate/isopropylmalate dehydrogenase
MYKVNPMAMLLAVKMMFDWLGEEADAIRLEAAIAAVIAEGKVRTYDMGGKATTLDVAHAVAAHLE